MDDYANTTVLCPLGHGLFIRSAMIAESHCPHCGVQLIDVDDESPTRSFRFVSHDRRDAVVKGSEWAAVMGVA